MVDLASLTDAKGIAESDVQAFLEATPYGGASFLDTYSSNGVRADDAIMQAAARYTLNPLVFLVAAEEAQGLIGVPAYPANPARVEYVFNCGCATAQASCDPAQTGFAAQVECLASQFRQSLDEVAANGHTAAGWGPGIASTTLDDAHVTPADASTAAVYQYIPTVAVGAGGGTWLFWNLWKKYAGALKYAGGGVVATPTASIGDGCTVDGNCAFQGGVCATNYPGGLCTATCTGQCPIGPGGRAAFCADFQQEGDTAFPSAIRARRRVGAGTRARRSPSSGARRPASTCARRERRREPRVTRRRSSAMSSEGGMPSAAAIAFEIVSLAQAQAVAPIDDRARRTCAPGRERIGGRRCSRWRTSRCTPR